MTREELIAYGQSRYGTNWMAPLAQETGYNISTIWKIATGRTKVVSRRLELEIFGLPLVPCVQSGSVEGESWRTVPSLNGDYEASNYGRIKRVTRNGARYGGRILKAAPDLFFNSGGYHVIRVKTSQGSKSLLLHRLIAETFLGPRPDDLVINHIDGNKANNSASNLEYITFKENIHHALRLGLIKPVMENILVKRSRECA